MQVVKKTQLLGVDQIKQVDSIKYIEDNRPFLMVSGTLFHNSGTNESE